MAKIKKSILLLTLLCLLGTFIRCPIITAAFSAPQLVSEIPAEHNVQSASITSKKTDSKHIVATTMQTRFNANDTQIWQALTDFLNYPLFFKRIKSVVITKRDGDLVYTESQLKRSLFVKCVTQHTINDLGAGPKILNWQMIDGNFKYLRGRWELSQQSPGLCSVKYTLYVDFGPIVPAPLVNFVVHQMQQEIVDQLKHYVEAEDNQPKASNKLSDAVNL